MYVAHHSKGLFKLYNPRTRGPHGVNVVGLTLGPVKTASSRR